jgi:hypothetical protein
LKGDPCNGGKNSKEKITILLAWIADLTDKLTPFVIGKSENPHCFKNDVKLPTKYVANRKAWATHTIFTDYLRPLHAKTSSQNRISRIISIFIVFKALKIMYGIYSINQR